MMWLRTITIACSEGQNVFSESFIVLAILLNLLVVIFATRTWAIYERSRTILVFLIGLTFVCTVVILHMSYVLLMRAVGGLRIFRDDNDRAVQFRGYWSVASLHLLGAK